MKRKHMIFDCEIIGLVKPVFLVGTKCVETGKREAFWFDKRGHVDKLLKMMRSDEYTWVGFNSENFDRPLISMLQYVDYTEKEIKEVANQIIAGRMKSWETYREFELDFLEYDHIDLFDVAPGVMISLKTYAGRIGHKSMVDMPFHHDHDISAKERKVLEDYCLNDLDVTEAMFKLLKTEVELRIEMSEEYGVDLRSKSDAQIAEAVLKKRVGISNGDKHVPSYVKYKAPSFIKTKDPQINELIRALQACEFKIIHTTGSPMAPKFLEEPVKVGKRKYQCGIGGLHSVEDNNMYLEANADMWLSDFDVASYYPNIMMKAGLVPKLGGGKGVKFMEEYRRLYELRMEAKRSGNKKIANSLKITLNGTFGKLGSIYCSFYSPELMLAVTLTGQLNLLMLISELDKIRGVEVRSANTDGIMVAYKPEARDKVLKVFERSSKATGFEYEETVYTKYAAKDVNNYLALTADGKVKAKGLYASSNPKLNSLYMMKNPTMEVSTLMAIDYLREGTLPEVSIKQYKDIKDFVAIRNVQGGGIQHTKTVMMDDWEEVEEGVWRRPKWPAMKASVRRKSRPPAVEEGVGGVPFGRVARWYMTKEKLPPLTYLSSGNKVPKTEGAKVCMILPDKLPKDLDFQWYVDEAYRILNDLGVKISSTL